MWPVELSNVAVEHSGGERSFSKDMDAHVAREYNYQPPNEDYEGLFTYNARLLWAQGDKASPIPRCTGWLIPEEQSTHVSKPLFIAHSLLAAIWLLRETVGDTALPESGWERLYSAAQDVMYGKLRISSDIVPETPMEEVIESIAAAAGWVSPSTQRALIRKPWPAPSTPHPKPFLIEIEDSPSSSKRSRLSVDASPASSAPAADDGTPAADGNSGNKDPVCYVQTTINHNRRTEQRREKELETLREKKRREIGLQPPAGPKPLDQEVAAYRSIAWDDEATIAWIVEQPIPSSGVLHSASSTPYYTACTILKKVRALENASSQCNVAQFLQMWWRQGMPFQTRAESRNLRPPFSPSAGAHDWRFPRQ